MTLYGPMSKHIGDDRSVPSPAVAEDFVRRIGSGAQLPVKILQLLFGEIFDGGETVLGALHRNDQLVELELNRLRVAVLGVLDEEHHQKGDDGRAGVDDELPGVAEVKQRPGDGPNQDRQCGKKKCGRCTGRMCGGMRKSGKVFAEQATLRTCAPSSGFWLSALGFDLSVDLFHCPLIVCRSSDSS